MKRSAYHADEETRLLRGTPDTGVTDDANGEASSKTRETDGQTSAELNEALVQRHLHLDFQRVSRRNNLSDLILTVTRNQDRHDETVDLGSTVFSYKHVG